MRCMSSPSCATNSDIRTAVGIRGVKAALRADYRHSGPSHRLAASAPVSSGRHRASTMAHGEDSYQGLGEVQGDVREES